MTDDPATSPPRLIGGSDSLEAPPPKRRHLLLAGALVAAVYLVGTNGQWWPTPDSALYQALARSIAEGRGYKFNGRPCTHVTPGLPLILAGFRLLLGPGYWPGNLFMTACGLASLLMAYLTLGRLGDRRIAAAAVLAAAMTQAFYSKSHLILTDAPFSLLFWSVLYAAVRCHTGSLWWLPAAFALAAAAITVRAPGIMLLAPAALGLAMNRSSAPRPGKRLASGAAVLAAVVLTAIAMLLLAQVLKEELPAYLARSIADPQKGMLDRIRDLGIGAMRLPEVFAEVLTDQEGMAIPVGVPAVVMVLIAAAILWRRGGRLLPTVVILCPLGLALVKGPRAVRTRYLMAIEPMMIYLTMVGLYWLVGRLIARGRSGLAGAKRHVLAVNIFAALVIASNFPRVARNAFYYGPAGYTGHYYEIIRGRAFADLPALVDAVRRACPDGGAVAADRKQRAILHFLTGRIIIPLPATRRQDEPDARIVHGFLLSCDQVRCAVLDAAAGEGQDESEVFVRRLHALLAETPGAKLLFTGERFVVYGLAGPGATAAPADPP